METTTLNYEQFHAEVGRARREHTSWRLGQTYFNVLHDMAPDLANEIRGGIDDPFYNDGLVPQFLEKVWEHCRGGASE